MPVKIRNNLLSLSEQESIFQETDALSRDYYYSMSMVISSLKEEKDVNNFIYTLNFSVQDSADKERVFNKCNIFPHSSHDEMLLFLSVPNIMFNLVHHECLICTDVLTELTQLNNIISQWLKTPN